MVACFVVIGLVEIRHCQAESPKKSVIYRTLTNRNESVRLRTIQRVIHSGPAARREALDDLIASVRNHAEETAADEIAKPSTVALINLIAEVDAPESEAVLVELLDAPHLGISMLSAEALGRKKFYGAIESLKRQTDREEYQTKYAFRFNLIRALAIR